MRALTSRDIPKLASSLKAFADAAQLSPTDFVHDRYGYSMRWPISRTGFVQVVLPYGEPNAAVVLSSQPAGDIDDATLIHFGQHFEHLCLTEVRRRLEVAKGAT